MKDLISKIKSLQKTEVKSKVDNRLKEFKSFESKNNLTWFSELCFCILTANSKARTAIAIQSELKGKGFLENSFEEVRDVIIANKHRFHNNKANFIVEARQFNDIKKIVSIKVSEIGEQATRDFLAENIKGIGYKEASHFMRNVGYFNLAILDRHILNLMIENNMLDKKPKTITKKIYHELEGRLLMLCDKLNMSQAELDLYLWFMKGGDVLK